MTNNKNRTLFIFFVTIFLVFFLSQCKTKPNDGHSGSQVTEEVDKDEVMATKRERCESLEKIYYAETDSCLKPKDYCDRMNKIDGSIWYEGKCLSKEQQCFLNEGSKWEGDRCLSAKEVCESYGSGFKYVDNTCLSPQQVCENKGFRYLWHPERQCMLKGFMDYCQGYESIPQVQKLISYLRSRPLDVGKVNGLAGCQDTYEWILNSTRLEIWDVRDHLQFADISPLMEFNHLKELILTNNRIEDLYPLQFLTNLELLDLQNNQKIADISHLAKLTNLKSLFLGHNKIHDLTPLKGMNQLKVLSLFDNIVSELEPLSKLTSIEELTLQNNPVENVAPLRNLSNLTRENFHADNTFLSKGETKADENNCPTQQVSSPAIKEFCESL